MENGILSITEAARTFNVSASTLRRLLVAGMIDGAYKERATRGREWRLPAAALEALGYHRATSPHGSEPVIDLASEVRRLNDDLRTERRRSRTLDGELGWALMDNARLHAALTADDVIGVAADPAASS